MSDSDIGEGLGSALGFVAAGIACLFVPDYLAATPGWTTFWYLVGAVGGLIGVVGALLELSRLGGDSLGLGYLGASVFVAGLGGLFHLVQARDIVGGQLGSAARILAVVLVLFALTGFGMGLGQLVSRVGTLPRDQRENHPVNTLTSTVVGLVGLATAVLNFLAAGSAG